MIEFLYLAFLLSISISFMYIFSHLLKLYLPPGMYEYVAIWERSHAKEVTLSLWLFFYLFH